MYNHFLQCTTCTLVNAKSAIFFYICLDFLRSAVFSWSYLHFPLKVLWTHWEKIWQICPKDFQLTLQGNLVQNPQIQYADLFQRVKHTQAYVYTLLHRQLWHLMTRHHSIVISNQALMPCLTRSSEVHFPHKTDGTSLNRLACSISVIAFHLPTVCQVPKMLQPQTITLFILCNEKEREAQTRSVVIYPLYIAP